LAIAAGVLLAVPAVSWAQPVPRPAEDAKSKHEESARLVAVLRSPAAEFDKAKACQRLAVVGDKEAIAALAALLADEKLSHYARFGLEANPDPAVDEALRRAMASLKGKFLVGVIDSIGCRKDAAAIGGLAQRLADPDPQVAAAAAGALGRIGSPEAAKILQQSLGAAAALRGAVADAMLACAESLSAGGKANEAVALYDTLAKADVPIQVRVAAVRGAILVRGAAGLPRLSESLRAADPALFAAALRVARELPLPEVTRLLLDEMTLMRPERKALVILALGDRGDPVALPTVFQAAKSGPPEVRAAALCVLITMGRPAEVVPVLLQAAFESDAEVAQTAQAGLVEIRGTEADPALLDLLQRSTDAKVRRVLVDAVGQRRIVSAVPLLVKAAKDADVGIRLSAVKSLGETAGPDQLPELVAAFLAARTPDDTAALQNTLTAISVRTKDRDACVVKLLAAAAAAPIASRSTMLDIAGNIGGGAALQAVVAAAKGGDPQLQDAAFRILGQWMTADAAPELLMLAKTAGNEKLKTRALRGYIRIARQLQLSQDQRLAMCRQAIAAASRNEEKRLALDALRRAQTAPSLDLAAQHLSEPALRDAAAAAAVAIAERLVGTQPAAVAKAMTQVVNAAPNKDLLGKAKLLLDRASKGVK
jgi:HEAT repeat protein